VPRRAVDRAAAIARLTKARRLHRRALRQWQHGATEPARRRVERAHTLLQQMDGNAAELLAVLGTLAGLAGAVADLDAAARWQRETVQTARTRLPAGAARDAWLAEALTGLGNTLRLAARHEEAAAMLAAADDTAGRPGVPSVHRAGCANARGILAKDTGDLAAAADHYARAQHLLEAEYGPDAPELAALHHNLAGLAHARGDYVEAEAPARRAVALRQSTCPPDPDGLASDRAVLGAVLVGQNRLDEATALFSEALAHWQTRYGPDHYEVAADLHHLAMIDTAQGRPATAQERLQTALSIKRHVLGEEHPEVRTLQQAVERDCHTSTNPASATRDTASGQQGLPTSSTSRRGRREASIGR
jgi:tetratricopeptide (TPR) repeat protein